MIFVSDKDADLVSPANRKPVALRSIFFIMTASRKIGILGGGQLGRMLALEAGPIDQPIAFLDTSYDVPAGPFARELEIGSFKDHGTVLDFGAGKDVIGIEIEHVDTDALRILRDQGRKIIPDPDILDIIKDKGRQKDFYVQNALPTSSFVLYPDKMLILEALSSGILSFPFVQKSRTAGYDGKGVAVICGQEDLYKLMDVPSVVEDCVDIEKELAVIVARNAAGNMRTFPPVEMLFNPDANLVENLYCPARIDADRTEELIALSRRTAEAFGIEGLLAIEYFLDRQGMILINEVAPRPHNSGHHTIEACMTSQYGQMLRILMGMPLGPTDLRQPAMMLNLLGAAGSEGPTIVHGLAETLSIPGVYVHLYGKQTCKPFRKMGHVTLLGSSFEELSEKAELVRTHLKISGSYAI